MISKEEYNSQSYNIEENPAVSELKSNATKYALDICRAYNLDGEVFQFPNSTTNSVFSVGSEQDRQVLKILPYDRLFFGEVSLLKRWSEAGVSVPRVTHKNDDKKIVPYCFFIMDYLPSSEVRVDNYKVSVVDELISNVIEQLKAGHKIQEVSFGWINYHTDQLGDPNWNTTLIKLLEGRGKSLVLQGALSIHDLERISVDVRSLPQIDQSSLLHGDLRPENVIVSPDLNVSIIDPDPIGGDGLYDVAYLSTSIGVQHVDSLQFLGKYLGTTPSNTDIRRWNIYRALSAIRQCSAVLKKLPSVKKSDTIKSMKYFVDEVIKYDN